MMALTLTLPEPPSANAYWRHVGARVLLSREARAYRLAVIDLVRALPLATRRQLPITGEVMLTLAWYRSRRAGDLDNRLKQPLDALQAAGVLVNDSQIVTLHATRAESPRAGRIDVTIVQAVQAVLARGYRKAR